MMAGMRRTRAERVAEREVIKFRRAMAEQEQRLLLVDKIREREKGMEGYRPMPFAGTRK